MKKQYIQYCIYLLLQDIVLPFNFVHECHAESPMTVSKTTTSARAWRLLLLLQVVVHDMSYSGFSERLVTEPVEAIWAAVVLL